MWAQGSANIIYYQPTHGSNPVKKFIESLEKKQIAKIVRILELITEYGLQNATTHIRKLTGYPFWEIRILGKDNIRLLYAVLARDSILLVHGFVKKKQKTPQKELETALTRYKDWLLRVDI